MMRQISYTRIDIVDSAIIKIGLKTNFKTYSWIEFRTAAYMETNHSSYFW